MVDLTSGLTITPLKLDQTKSADSPVSQQSNGTSSGGSGGGDK